MRLLLDTMLIGPTASCDWQSWRLQGHRLAVVDIVADEARDGGDGARHARRQAFLDDAVRAGLLEVAEISVNTSEFFDYERLMLGRVMDRGECASIAVCLHDPHAMFVTCDTVALFRAVGELGPGMRAIHPFDALLALRDAGLSAAQARALRDAWWTLGNLRELHRGALPDRIADAALADR